jgi:hypothetical protein
MYAYERLLRNVWFLFERKQTKGHAKSTGKNHPFHDTKHKRAHKYTHVTQPTRIVKEPAIIPPRARQLIPGRGRKRSRAVLLPIPEPTHVHAIPHGHGTTAVWGAIPPFPYEFRAIRVHGTPVKP